jgi:hypothetical protein
MRIRLSSLPYLLGLCLPVTVGTWVGDAGGPGVGWTVGLLMLPVTMTAAFVVDRLIPDCRNQPLRPQEGEDAAMYAASQSK